MPPLRSLRYGIPPNTTASLTSRQHKGKHNRSLYLLERYDIPSQSTEPLALPRHQPWVPATVRSMTPPPTTAHSAGSQDALPPEIYIPLVDSLYKDGRTLLTGTFFVIGSIFTTYWKTGEPLLLACALAVIAVACARGLVMRAYLRVQAGVSTN